jgi:hypothetical protein
MARYSAGGRTTTAASATLPMASLYASASGYGKIREIGIANTTTTAFVAGLCRLTTAGTVGAALTIGLHNLAASPAICAAYNSHSSTGPTLTDLGYRWTIGAAAGAGIPWTFGDEGLVIPATANYGIGIYCPTGTGQVADVYFVWDE